MKKRFLSGTLALLLVISCFGGLTASAAAAPVEAGLAKLNYTGLTAADVAVIQDASTYAYMSLEIASAAMKEKILDAREDIIFHQSWTTEGNTSADYGNGVLVELPMFYDVFPSDWDVPAAEKMNKRIDSSNLSILNADSIPVWEGNAPVLKASESNNAQCFRWFTAFKCYMTVQAITLTNVSRVNIGLTNGTTGLSVAHAMNVAVHGYCQHLGTYGVTYGARVSTSENTSAGVAYMRIRDEYSFVIDIFD